MLPRNVFKIMGGEETGGLEKRFRGILRRLKVGSIERKVLEAFLSPLKYKNSFTHFHYQHSLRVAILLEAIAGFAGSDRKSLVYAGALHDIGKALIPAATLDITKKSWTRRDGRIMQRHVLSGYQLLQGCFDFTAEIILWHHRFQKGGYPRKRPPLLHGYSPQTLKIIIDHGRLLALADCYDASHRKREQDGKLVTPGGEEIRKNMFRMNGDVKELVAGLYQAGIFAI